MTRLIGPLLWAMMTMLALRPPSRRGRGGFLTYVLTMTVNELPLVFGAVILSSIAIGERDPLSGTWVMLEWVLWGVVLGGLLWIQIRAGKARGVLELALGDALGPNWTTAIRTDLRGRLRLGTPWLWGMLAPFQRRRWNVTRIRNVAYGPDPLFHRLDVYRGTKIASGPILIHFHEGGFVQGGKSRESVYLLNRLAGHGWLCISANYRLRADGQHPAPLVDAKRVIAWARAHAVDFAADPTAIYAVGGSAGGHLAVSAALTPDDLRLQPGFETADTTVSGAVSLYGYLGPRTADPTSGPVGLARADAPPLLLIAAENDSVIPPAASQAWYRTLGAASHAPVAHALIPGAQHAFDLFASVRARTTAHYVEAFLAWTRSQGEEPRGSLASGDRI